MNTWGRTGEISNWCSRRRCRGFFRSLGLAYQRVPLQMRLIPVPDSAVAKYPEYVKKIMSPPDGDLLSEECRPADMLIGVGEFMGEECYIFRGFFQMEPQDVDRLRENGGVLELQMVSHVVPFNVFPL